MSYQVPMRVIGLAVALTVSLILVPLVGKARQQPRKVPRVCVLSPFSSSFGPGPSFEAFRETLRELGYVEGRNIALEYRWADGRYDRLPGLTTELVRLQVDVMSSAWSTPVALATRKATSTIPIVFAGVGDAVGVGLVANLARPGGNVTQGRSGPQDRPGRHGHQSGQPGVRPSVESDRRTGPSLGVAARSRPSAGSRGFRARLSGRDQGTRGRPRGRARHGAHCKPSAAPDACGEGSAVGGLRNKDREGPRPHNPPSVLGRADHVIE